MAIIQTKINVRNNVAKKRLKKLTEEKEINLQKDRENFKAISAIIKKKSEFLKKKRT